MRRPRMRFNMLTLLAFIALMAIGFAVWERYVVRTHAGQQFDTITASLKQPSSEEIKQARQMVRRYPQLVTRRNAMLWAASYADVEMCRYFLDHGAFPQSRNGMLEPIYCAVLNDRLDVIELLIEYGVDPAGPHALNDTPGALLIVAAKKEYSDICELLLREGVFTKLAERDQRYVLYRAICDGNVKLVQLYLEQGAVYPHSENYSLQSAISKAVRQWPTSTKQEAVDEIVRLLKQYNAVEPGGEAEPE